MVEVSGQLSQAHSLSRFPGTNCVCSLGLPLIFSSLFSAAWVLGITDVHHLALSFFLLNTFKNFYVYGCFANMCTSCLPSAMEVRKYPISWNLGYRCLIVSQYMGAGNWTWDFWNNS